MDTFLKSPALQFISVVAASYGLMWSCAHLATSAATQRKSVSQIQQEEFNSNDNNNSNNNVICQHCYSRLQTILEKQNESSSSSNNNISAATQLQITILMRLLQDKNMIPSSSSSSGNETSSSSSSSTSLSSCTCPSHLRVTLPCLEIPSQSYFESLSSPAVFYETLLDRISKATKRIVISSLYIGSGPRSKRLVATIEKKLQQQPDIELLIVLDYCRMHIGPNLAAIKPIITQIEKNKSNNSSISSSSSSSSSKMNQHQQQNQNQMICLFLPPSSVGNLVRNFGRAREAQGVQHTKLFVFDDDVILSGANLSDDYFLDRMDRYISISASSSLPPSPFRSDENLSEQDNNNNNNNTNKSPTELANHMHHLAKALAKVSFPVSLHNNYQSYNNNNNQSCIATPNTHYGFDASQAPEVTLKFFGAAMAEFEQETSTSLSDWLEKIESRMFEKKNSKNSLVIPSLQFARAGVFTDLAVMEALLSFDLKSTFNNNNKINRVIASPYLNTHHAFVDQMFSVCKNRLKESNSNNDNNNNNNIIPAFTFVTCSPSSNAWKGSKGLAAVLPQLYYSLVRSFYFLVEDYGYHQLVDVREFEKYHLVDPSSGEYSNLPEGLTADTFSPYVRPDDEEENSDDDDNNNKTPRVASFEKSTNNNNNNTPEKLNGFQQQQQQEQEENVGVGRGFPSPSSTTSILSETHRVASATFHAKGIWFVQCCQSPTSSSSSQANSNNTNNLLPFATVVGSNNLGERCVFKDVESDFVILTENPQVQTVLGDEVEAILKHSNSVSRSEFLSNGDGVEKLGRFQPVIEVIASMMSSYL